VQRQVLQTFPCRGKVGECLNFFLKLLCYGLWIYFVIAEKKSQRMARKRTAGLIPYCWQPDKKVVFNFSMSFFCATKKRGGTTLF
jgi:hypothetical protein